MFREHAALFRLFRLTEGARGSISAVSLTWISDHDLRCARNDNKAAARGRAGDSRARLSVLPRAEFHARGEMERFVPTNQPALQESHLRSVPVRGAQLSGR